MAKTIDYEALIKEIKRDLDVYLQQIRQGEINDITPVVEKIQQLTPLQRGDFEPIKDLGRALTDIELMLQEISQATNDLIDHLTQTHKVLAEQAKGTQVYAKKAKGRG